MTAAYRSAQKLINSPKEKVQPEVNAGLHGVIPAVNVSNFHEEDLIRR